MPARADETRRFHPDWEIWHGCTGSLLNPSIPAGPFNTEGGFFCCFFHLVCWWYFHTKDTPPHLGKGQPGKHLPGGDAPQELSLGIPALFKSCSSRGHIWFRSGFPGFYGCDSGSLDQTFSSRRSQIFNKAGGQLSAGRDAAESHWSPVCPGKDSPAWEPMSQQPLNRHASRVLTGSEVKVY